MDFLEDDKAGYQTSNALPFVLVQPPLVRGMNSRPAQRYAFEDVTCSADYNCKGEGERQRQREKETEKEAEREGGKETKEKDKRKENCCNTLDGGMSERLKCPPNSLLLCRAYSEGPGNSKASTICAKCSHFCKRSTRVRAPSSVHIRAQDADGLLHP